MEILKHRLILNPATDTNQEIFLTLLSIHTDITHDAQVDRNDFEPLTAAIVGKRVLVYVTGGVLGLTEVTKSAGDGRAEDHKVQGPLMAEVFV